MTSVWLTLPVVLSLLTATGGFFVRNNPKAINWISGSSVILSVFCSVQLLADITTNGPYAVAFGNWMAPFGIVFVADFLAVAMTVITAIIGAVTVFYAMADLKHKPPTASTMCYSMSYWQGYTEHF